MLAYIGQQGATSIQGLFDRFDASEATIRRDLVLLERQHLIIRRRGEVYIRKETQQSPFDLRSKLNQEAKVHIARIAAAQIQEHDTIILDAGTTTLEIAKLITGHRNLTVLTNSLPVANILANTSVSLSLAGGHLFSQNMSTQGPEAEAFFRKVEVSKAFIGASGVRRLIGLETLNPFEAQIKKLMIASARTVFAVLDATKFSTAGINVFCEFQELDTIITDQSIPDEELVHLLDRHQVSVITAHKEIQL